VTPVGEDETGFRRRNWLAIAIGTVVMMFSYFPYAAAFAGSGIDGGLAAIGLTLAPMVLVAVAFVSHNPRAAR
jgi:hypothetical protein